MWMSPRPKPRGRFWLGDAFSGMMSIECGWSTMKRDPPEAVRPMMYGKPAFLDPPPEDWFWMLLIDDVRVVVLRTILYIPARKY